MGSWLNSNFTAELSSALLGYIYIKMHFKGVIYFILCGDKIMREMHLFC